MDIKKLLYKLSFGFSCLPIYMAVNISNLCNRRCNFCPYHSKFLKGNYHTKWVRKQPMYLNVDNFNKFMKRLGIFRKLIKHIAVTGKGETMLHHEFISICSIINYYKIPFSVTTNGDFMTDEKLSALFSMRHLEGIRVSMYEYDEDLINLSQIFKKITIYNQTGKEIAGIETGYTAQVDGVENFCTLPKDFNKATSCKAPFYFMTINTDGSVVPCYTYYEIGNISDSFLKLWNGKKIRRYRMDALKMKQTFSDCKNCMINYK